MKVKDALPRSCANVEADAVSIRCPTELDLAPRDFDACDQLSSLIVIRFKPIAHVALGHEEDMSLARGLIVPQPKRQLTRMEDAIWCWGTERTAV